MGFDGGTNHLTGKQEELKNNNNKTKQKQNSARRGKDEIEKGATGKGLGWGVWEASLAGTRAGPKGQEVGTGSW